MAETTSDRVTPLEGKTVIDDKMFFEPERLSYESANQIAENIAARLPLVEDKPVVIAGVAFLADLANLQSAYLELESLQRDYESIASLGLAVVERQVEKKEAVAKSATKGLSTNLLGETIFTVFAPATAFANAAIGLVSLFREDVEYHGARTTIDALAFEIALAAQLKPRKVFVPDLTLLPAVMSDESSLNKRLYRVQRAKAKAWFSIGPLITELGRLEGALAEAAQANDQELFNRLSSEISDLRRKLQPISDPLSRCDARLADLHNRFEQVGESRLSLLARLLRAEAIKAEDPIYLHAAVVSSGGYHRVSRNLFRMIFLGDGLSFAGGAIVRWAILQSDGGIENAGILIERRTSSSRAKTGMEPQSKGPIAKSLDQSAQREQKTELMAEESINSTSTNDFTGFPGKKG